MPEFISRLRSATSANSFDQLALSCVAIVPILSFVCASRLALLATTEGLEPSASGTGCQPAFSCLAASSVKPVCCLLLSLPAFPILAIPSYLSPLPGGGLLVLRSPFFGGPFRVAVVLLFKFFVPVSMDIIPHLFSLVKGFMDEF